MTETLALTGLGLFMGFMVLCVALLIHQSHRKHQHVLKRWQDLAHRHHWTFAHRNTTPRWEIRSATWKVTHLDSSLEGFADQVVFHAPLKKSPPLGIVVARPKWKRWQKTLASPHPALKTRDLAALQVPHLEGLLTGLQHRHGIPEHLHQHFVVLGHGASPLVLRVLEQHVQQWPPSLQAHRHLHVLLDQQGLTVQVDGLEFTPENVLPLIQLAEQLLGTMQGT
ncbi:hypothetical protein [Deinococcus cellulosilyticus]|nr:hypothetical protein [Deinococcus cellulosilyticus]